MNKCFFVTGTDTGSGKTMVSCSILQKANSLGYVAVGYKPVSTGISKKYPSKNSDISLLKKYSKLKLRDQEISPVMFFQDTSPHIASKMDRRRINLNDIDIGLENLRKKANFIVIEGIGGWYTPLSSQIKLCDWVKLNNFPIILTVSFRIGCINHALLSIEAIQNSNLRLIGWIANMFSMRDRTQSDYFYSLLHLIPYPCIGIIPKISNWKVRSIKKFIKSKYII
ncbi:dethiobiotin synthase [Candidatus Riesia pediculicola]|uniref:ATP-dependent dethiobiotin synthetase BioD n=1 Tax=Riesia pediculicola (strain USDA) TaxID=515618 RepID=D4G8Z0_RIEPU|nr:dethiobiotin synthase [Candidatus Riesia pediculicola]ADD79932.1 dethiobiotin synthase [Candidatus Riesia pediculicola USDA]ARC53999.1 hypothetical protein AOE55_02500 [Candidatus Riesia pediculicola]ARC54572.1 hypothetical protein AOE56_02890 [Candidatus Riesia pediculicola]QOJ86625.1 dethiobiotin synthase [Candidatus Riesia pediculicola]